MRIQALLVLCFVAVLAACKSNMEYTIESGENSQAEIAAEIAGKKLWSTRIVESVPPYRCIRTGYGSNGFFQFGTRYGIEHVVMGGVGL